MLSGQHRIPNTNPGKVDRPKMSIFDSLQQMAGQLGGNTGVSTEDTGKVAGGFIKAAEEHPGGLGGILQQLTQNGMGDHVQQWAQGNQAPVAPDQVQQGMGDGLIERVAAHAGVSPQVATTALAVVLPMLMQHLAPGGQPAAPQGQLGGLASSILGRML